MVRVNVLNDITRIPYAHNVAIRSVWVSTHRFVILQELLDKTVALHQSCRSFKFSVGLKKSDVPMLIGVDAYVRVRCGSEAEKSEPFQVERFIESESFYFLEYLDRCCFVD